MMTRFRNWWNDFFLSEEVPYGLALVRITLPLVLLIGVLPRWGHVRELYSTDGAPTPLWVSYGTSPLVPELPAPVAVGLYSLLVFALVSASLGWRTRLSLALSMVLYAGFGVLDMVSTLTKYTVLATHALLLLSLSECGALWSVDSWLQRRSLPAVITGQPKSPVWPKRLLQLLLGMCYLGAAFTKMHTPAYFSGEQMQFWMLANMNFENPVGEFLSLYPPVSVISAYVTIVWEVLFIALVWRRPWRGIVLAVGVLFHIMSSLMLGLIVFPMVCMTMYLVFLDQSDVARVALKLRSLRQTPGLQSVLMALKTPPAWLHTRSSLAAFALLAAASAVMGAELEYHLDVYQQRTSDGPQSLSVLDPQAAARMLGPERPIRPQDLFFSCDVGTATVGGVLADRRTTFRAGERAILQCNMTPPHPDMWVEVALHDEQDRVIRRFGQVISREQLRSNFTYLFDEILTAGRYQFVVTYDDTEIARRPITFEVSAPSRQSVPGLTAAH